MNVERMTQRAQEALNQAYQRALRKHHSQTTVARLLAVLKPRLMRRDLLDFERVVASFIAGMIETALRSSVGRTPESRRARGCARLW
jgi:hypothetical protein